MTPILPLPPPRRISGPDLRPDGGPPEPAQGRGATRRQKTDLTGNRGNSEEYQEGTETRTRGGETRVSTGGTRRRHWCSTCGRGSRSSCGSSSRGSSRCGGPPRRRRFSRSAGPCRGGSCCTGGWSRWSSTTLLSSNPSCPHSSTHPPLEGGPTEPSVGGRKVQTRLTRRHSVVIESDPTRTDVGP